MTCLLRHVYLLVLFSLGRRRAGFWSSVNIVLNFVHKGQTIPCLCNQTFSRQRGINRPWHPVASSIKRAQQPSGARLLGTEALTMKLCQLLALMKPFVPGVQLWTSRQLSKVAELIQVKKSAVPQPKCALTHQKHNLRGSTLAL